MIEISKSGNSNKHAQVACPSTPTGFWSALMHTKLMCDTQVVCYPGIYVPVSNLEHDILLPYLGSLKNDRK
jgi:hypothetical protein